MKKLLCGFLAFILASNGIVYTHNPVSPLDPIIQQYTNQVDQFAIVSVQPILIPFNKSLFDRYCTAMIAQSAATESQYIKAFTWGGALLLTIYASPLCSKLLQLTGYCIKNGVPAYLNTIWHATKNSIDFHTFGASCGTLINSCIYTASTLFYLSSFTQCTTLFATGIQGLRAKDYDEEQEEWQKKTIIPVTQQEVLWHTIIHKHFGNPTIIGTLPTDQAYLLVFNKKYGAGQVAFDPQNSEQVEILLGIHETKKDDLRCDTIEIKTI
jgi:hypothetical protein